MRKVKIHSDQNKPSLQIKETRCYGITMNPKEAKKLMRKAKEQFIYALKPFGTLVTSISEYGIEFWAIIQVSKSWNKNPTIIQIYLSCGTIDSRQFC